MKMAENQVITRSSRHQQRNDQSPGGRYGKHIFTLISILLFSWLLGEHTSLWVQETRAQAQDRFEHGAATLLSEIQEERNQWRCQPKSEKQRPTKEVLYVRRKSKASYPLKIVKTLEPYAKAKKKIKSDDKNVLVGKLDVKSVSDQLDVYTLVAENYRWM